MPAEARGVGWIAASGGSKVFTIQGGTPQDTWHRLEARVCM